MVIDRAGALIDLLREHHLVDAGQLEELTRSPDALDTDPQLLGQCLIELGWLTPYQVDQLINNRPQDLVLGSYHLLDRLGQSEVGPTFQARKPGKPGVVTLKIIPKPRIGDPQRLALFQQEVRIAAQLQHPHIAPVAAVGQQGNLFLFAREFVPGADLSRLVRELGPLPVFVACNAARHAALALQCAHEKGLAHRRIKASNLIAVDQPGAESTVKLVDFGLGLLKPSATAGLDVPGDLADLGQTLSFLMTGQIAPAGTDGLPAEIREVLRRLDRYAVDRFATAGQAAQALEPFSQEPAPPPAVPVNGVAPAGEPAELPVATAMVEAASMIAPEPPVPDVAAVVPLEGIAVPVMATAVDPGVSVPEPEAAALISATATAAVVAEAPAIESAAIPGSTFAPQEPEPPPVAPEPIAEFPAVTAPKVMSEASPIESPDSGSTEAKPSEGLPANAAFENQPALAPWEAGPALATEAPPLETGTANFANAAPDSFAPAPLSEPGPAGYFTDQPAPAGIAADETSVMPVGTEIETPTRRAPVKKKWSKSTIMWLIVGALLHLVAAVILVIAVIALMNREKPPKNRPGVPAKPKSRAPAELKVPSGIAFGKKDRLA